MYSYCQSRCHQDAAAQVPVPTAGHRLPALDKPETEVCDLEAVATAVIARWTRWSKRWKREGRVLKDQAERLVLLIDWIPRTSIMEGWERVKWMRREVNNGSWRDRSTVPTLHIGRILTQITTHPNNNINKWWRPLAGYFLTWLKSLLVLTITY